MEHLGVRCYGYITLNDTHLAFMRKKYDFKHWFYDPKFHKHEPVRAIVKELVYMPRDDLPEEEYVALHVTPKTVSKMFKDLKTMHHLGISINDVDFENYIHGKFVDLSHAWTAPHPLLLKGKNPREFPPLRGAKEDAMKMDEFIDNWNACYPDQWIWNRLLPNPSYIRKLRRRKGRKTWWDVRPENFTYESAAKRFKTSVPRHDTGGRISERESHTEASHEEEQKDIKSKKGRGARGKNESKPQISNSKKSV